MSPQKVLLIHGSLGSAWNFWKTKRALAARGHEVLAVNYGKLGLARYPQCVAEVRQQVINKIGHKNTHQWTIVGHSLGGMIGATLAEEMPFRRVIGLGACFRGLPPLRMMRTDLKDQANFPDLHSAKAELVSVVSSHDEVVPPYTSIIPEYLGHTYRVWGYSHTQLPNLPMIPDLVEREYE
ncbi:MAG: alpha/beta fold hydrolase [Corynebacterium sp.]|nr:alpha/beta fold hydrolase [Corynebacterium sp.]